MFPRRLAAASVAAVLLLAGGTDAHARTTSALSAAQFDSNRASGIGLQTRMHASKPINNRTRAGSRYGRTDDLAGINDQSHLAGPIIDIRTDNGWSVFTGVLLGLTNGSPDAQIRLWLTRSL